MPSPTRIPVHTGVLIWARETAGIDPDTAAQRIGVQVDRVRAWESGGSTPTINQIRTMADVYHRPLAAFFMSEPIAGEQPRKLPDFRRPQQRDQPISRALQKALMRAHRQRDALIEIADELGTSEDATIAKFSFSMASNSEELGELLRSLLRLDKITAATVSRPEELLRILIRASEQLNVTVIQTQRVDVDEMRGFSLGEGMCSVAALNGADWPRGRIFTLLHELVHIGLRTSGLCDLQHEVETRIERKCDEVASAALMPRDDVTRLVELADHAELTGDLARSIGNQFGASGESAVLRLITLGYATWEDYWRLKPSFNAAYRRFKADEKAKNAGKDSPIFYQLKVRDLGRKFIRSILQAYGEEALSTRDVVQLLEVTYDKLPKLAGAVKDDVA